MEVLIRMVIKAVEGVFISGFGVGCLCVPHLMFADDTIMFNVVSIDQLVHYQGHSSTF